MDTHQEPACAKQRIYIFMLCGRKIAVRMLGGQQDEGELHEVTALS